MSKILSLTVICCLLFTIVKSQGVAINSDGSAPDTSAMLDVKSSNKGVLIPRLALTGIHDSATIHFPKTSLLVYNTATAGILTPGFYYWNVNAWAPFGGFNYVLQQNLNTNGKYISGDGSNNGLLLDSNGIVLGKGALGSGNDLPTQDSGALLIWYPKKAAFRAGYNTGAWQDAYIGKHSIAMGFESSARAYASVALGQSSTAAADGSAAIGNLNYAGGINAAAMGNNCTANAPNSIAIGDGASTHLGADGSMAMGSSTYVSGIYGTAMGRLSQALGNTSTAMGYNTYANGDFSTSMGSNCTAGRPYSFVAGDSANTSGTNSYAMGTNIFSSGTYSFALGNNIFSSGNNSFTFGTNVNANGANSFALGNYATTNYLGSFIIGDRSTTSIATSNSTNQMTMRFDNGYRLFTNSATTIGVMLAGGGNAWSTISDVNRKENFEPVDGETFLQKISAMPLTTWNYKGQDPGENRHYGPMAQDFYTAFGKDEYGTIGNDTTINQADFDGINFIGIQALEKRTTDLKTGNSQLKEENARLEADVKKLKDQLENLTKLVMTLSAKQ